MSVNSKMTALANEIRELSGTTAAIGLDAMATHIGEANDEVDSQAELIAQIASALDGKAAGGDSIYKSIIDGTITEISDNNATQIKAGTFQSCAQLTSISFPVCTKIGTNAFSGCTSLTTASFPVCTTIGSSAFYSCPKLKDLSFPVCTSIGSYAFYGNKSIPMADFPVCSYIGSGAFQGCNLMGAYFPAVKAIEENTFYYCTYLCAISGYNCTRIGAYAFYNCNNLSNISFPVCTNIYSYAFYHCNLTTINFPACTYIGS